VNCITVFTTTNLPHQNKPAVHLVNPATGRLLLAVKNSSHIVTETENWETSMRQAHGFTLIELMITMTIVAIVATIAAPSFTAIIRNNQITTEANRLITGLKLARSEAIKRSAPVTACLSSVTTSCDGNPVNLLIFRDTTLGNTGAPDANQPAELLKVIEGLNANITKTRTNNIGFFRYNNLGRLINLNALAPTTITLSDAECTAGTVDQAKVITLGQDGNATIKKANCP
jgi:type IV fimbrial biogenesis protein FimT